MAVQIGPKIGIEGEKEYKQALKQIVNETKNLDAAMRKTESEWNNNTSAMTKNKAVAQNLVEKINLEEQRISALNGLLAQSAEKYGEASSAAQSYGRSIDYATARLNGMKADLANLKGAEGLSSMSTQMADFGTKMQNIGQSMMSVGQKLTTSLTIPIAAAGAAAVKLGSDLEESTNKVDVVFGEMSGTVKEFASNATEAFAISEGKALEMAGDFGAMATSMGLSKSEAAKLSTEMVGLAGDMASFHNKSTEVAANSLKGVFTGETEALKQFGVAMTQTNLEEFAAKQGKVYNQMDQGDKIMTRYQYLLESQKDAIGDASRTMDGFAGSTRKLKAALENAGAALGEALIPVITPMIQVLTKLAQKFAELPAPVQTFIAILLTVVASVGPVIFIIGTLMNSLGSIITTTPLIVAKFAQMGEAVLALAADFEFLNLSAAPWLAIAAAVVVAGAAIAYKWDDISAAAVKLGTKVSEAFSQFSSANDVLISMIRGFTDKVVEAFKALPRKIVEALREAVAEIKQAFADMISNAKQSGKDFVQGFVDGIKSRVQKIIDAVKDIADTIKDYLGFSCPDKGPLSKYETWMPDFMDGLAKGIYQNKSVVTKAINSLSKDMALPLSANASMNMAIAGAGADGGSIGMFGGMTTNVYVDHINDLEDLIRIQNQAQQRYRMGAR